MKNHVQELIKRILDYDPDTGLFRWKVQMGRAKVGEIAGNLNPSGYLEIQFYGRREAAHRLAHLYMFGALPTISIDHINGNRSDNRIENIVEVGQSTNLKNAKISTRNRSGVVGVFWNKKERRWRSVIHDFNGKVIYKTSSTLLDAVAWRKGRESEYGYSINCGRKYRHVDDCEN